MTRTREAKETDGLTKAITKSRSKPINNCRDGNDRPHITLLFNGQYNLTAEFKQFWRENSLSAMTRCKYESVFTDWIKKRPANGRFCFRFVGFCCGLRVEIISA